RRDLAEPLLVDRAHRGRGGGPHRGLPREAEDRPDGRALRRRAERGPTPRHRAGLRTGRLIGPPSPPAGPTPADEGLGRRMTGRPAGHGWRRYAIMPAASAVA